MKTSSFPLFLFVAALGLTFNSAATAQEVMNIEGPPSAPIYVLEGHFVQSFDSNLSNGQFHAEVDADETMDINTGALTAQGSMLMEGVAYTDYGAASFDLGANMTIKAVVKQAGTAVRWSGKAAVKGGGGVDVPYYGYEPVTFAMTLTYTNMTLDPASGEQSGQVSLSGSAKANGVKVPIKQAPTYTVIPRPENLQISGEWKDTSGRWASSISPSVDSKGKVSGIAQLVLGDPADPYAIVDQKVAGKLNAKTGIVAITGIGASKSTSKTKISLSYLQSTVEIVPNKSSVSAYGQTKRF